METLSRDSGTAVDFLQAFKPSGPWILTAISPDRKILNTKTFHADNLAEIRDWIESRNGKMNLYFHVNSALRDLTKKAERADIASLDWLHVDIDPRPGEDIEEERKRALDLLRAPPGGIPEPTVIVFSGGGYQGFWRLEKPIEINGDLAKAEEAKLYNMQLELIFGADNCHNVDRIMRLPGTVNIPDEKKLKKGRKETVAALVEHHADRVYDISLFSKAQERAGKRKLAPPTLIPGKKTGPDADPLSFLPLKLPDELVTLILNGEQQGKTWPSRSHMVWHVTCELIRHEVDDDIISRILTFRAYGFTAHIFDQPKPEEYALRQIQNAHEEINNAPLILSKGTPYRSAGLFIHRVGPSLLHYNGDYHAYNGRCYERLEDDSIRKKCYSFLSSATEPVRENEAPKPFHPNRSAVNDLLDAVRGRVHMPKGGVSPPFWLKANVLPVREMLAFPNGLLHVPSGVLYPPSAHFFTYNALAFNYDPAAPKPIRWLRYLEQVLPDKQSVDTLQEITGYLLLPDNSQQKIFLIVGPTRSGKGTYGRIVTLLLGQGNVAGPSLSSLATNFGLSTLIGKQLALMSDMRLGGKTDVSALTENLLRISGEDLVTIDRKYKDAWEGTLTVRFLIITNAIPKLPDSSNAVTRRFVPIIMPNSFYGNEDHTLTEKLVEELPGILNWALEGWRRLKARGYLIVPEASRDVLDTLHDLASPISSFIAETCDLDVTAQVPKERLFAAWQKWCATRGQFPGVLDTFARDLKAAAPIDASRTRKGSDTRTPVFIGIKLKDKPQGSPEPDEEAIPF